MVRVAVVVFGIPIAVALSLVMLVADTTALIALAVVPLPVIHVMGGINPEQNAIAWFVLRVQLVCWITLPLWIVAGAVASVLSPWLHRLESRGDRRANPGSSRGALAFAALAVVAWSAALPFTQPEQMLAYRVDRSYRRAGPIAALDLMSAHDPEEFPPGWQPPPRKFPGEPPFDEVVDMLEAVDESRHAAWVCDRICDRFIELEGHHAYDIPGELFGDSGPRLVRILTRLKRGRELAHALGPRDEWAKRFPEATEEQRATLKALRSLAGEEIPNAAAGPPEPENAAGWDAKAPESFDHGWH